ncbi:MAG: T9SS type A sorting domain-containing protein [Saprospiraceae bacterium]|nr:T9SS type A sorting domain-containing protein [Saprospiraceae bacterium]
MKQHLHARKRRQLKYLVKQFKTLSNDHRSSVKLQLDVLVRKIKSLVRELSSVLAPYHLKRMLGPAAFLLGISFGSPLAAQTFSGPVENPFGLIAAYSYTIPAFADLDDDGDLDIMAGEYYGNLQYYQNTGSATNPQFAAPVENPFGLTEVNVIAFPTLADLDDDGDMDLLVGDGTGVMKYFQNTGTSTNPQFAPAQLNPFGLNSTNVFSVTSFVDLDDDGDMDLMVGQYGGSMQYFRNNGTPAAPQFGAPQLNPFGITSMVDLASPTFADLDNDGDLDMLVGEYYGNMQYFENTGTATNPQFAAKQQNPFGLTEVIDAAFPAFADLDSDGDMDLLIGEYGGNMQYYTNTTSVGTQEELTNIHLNLFPNPVANVLTIQTDTPFETMEAFDALGKLVGQYDGSRTNILVSNWESGVYVLKFTDAQGRYTTRRLLKE